MSKIWFITGCSTGFGRELAKHVLASGDFAVVTARNADQILDIVGDYPEHSIALKLDVTNKEEIIEAYNEAIKRFGQIDVLVNNAGIGYFGSIEESDETEIRKMFEVNFFALAEVTRIFLPGMRARRSGHIVNISSIGGLVAFPAVGFYNATKFALVGYSESLAKELDPLGIKVSIICPSGFRTDWAGRSANEAKNTIADYETTAVKNQFAIRGYSGNQPGDPKRAALAIVKAVNDANPPLHLLLGAAALKGATNKLLELKLDFDTWEATTIGADFPKQD